MKHFNNKQDVRGNIIILRQKCEQNKEDIVITVIARNDTNIVLHDITVKYKIGGNKWSKTSYSNLDKWSKGAEIVKTHHITGKSNLELLYCKVKFEMQNYGTISTVYEY